jgi:hypothetical protein
MKYVILNHPTLGMQIRTGLSPQTHEQLSATLVSLGYTPTSAGFLRLTLLDRIETFGRSSSLNLGPNLDGSDALLLTLFYKATLETAA